MTNNFKQFGGRGIGKYNALLLNILAILEDGETCFYADLNEVDKPQIVTDLESRTTKKVFFKKEFQQPSPELISEFGDVLVKQAVFCGYSISFNDIQ